MINIEIKANEQGQRLDRFLRKYFERAPLSLIYKMIRRDVRVNRDRSNGLYFVRYVDPEAAERNKPDGGLLSKLAFWRSSAPPQQTAYH